MASALGCGASVHDLRTGGRAVTRGGPLPAAVRRAVLLRDRCSCRVPGCNRRRYVDVHHLVEQAHGGEHSRRNCLVLCSTHHRLLHEGKLNATGDAEGELCFVDASGRPISAPIASRTMPARTTPERQTATLESPRVGTLGATQGGSSLSSDGPAAEGDAAGAAELSSLMPTTRLLHVMGRRRGWTQDALVESSGLPAQQVAVALTLLELKGQVRCRDGSFEPV